jgi:hypothetical protein
VIPALPDKRAIVASLIEYLDRAGDPDILRKVDAA